METDAPPTIALKEAIRRAGSQSALARAIGLTQAAVWGWLKHGIPVPPKHVIAIETHTGVSRHDLNPDIYPRDTLPAPDPDPLGFEHAR